MSNNSSENVTSEIYDETHDFLVLKSVLLLILVAWTVSANGLVFVVLYKFPRLRTLPNLLVGNLAFSDFCLGLVVLPMSAVYSVTYEWPFHQSVCEIWISLDILLCTASIWNLCMIGLDRYWAITTPVTYLTKRNLKSALLMIASVWLLAAMISVTPLLGWKQFSQMGNYWLQNETNSFQCSHFLDLPGFTIYSATGSFFIPLIVMFFVYFRIYYAFSRHRARQIYRQKVIKKHLESTIMHDLSHVLPTSDEFARSGSEPEDDDDDDEESDEVTPDARINEEPELNENEDVALTFRSQSPTVSSAPVKSLIQDIKQQRRRSSLSLSHLNLRPTIKPVQRQNTPVRGSRYGRRAVRQSTHAKRRTHTPSQLTYERVARHKRNKEKRLHLRKSLQTKPKAISAAKERRGVRVLGIVLGCFALCWTPFFIMYLLTSLCSDCGVDSNVETFITWLGYANSAVNPILYTVFNRDYQVALKKLFFKNSRR